MAVYKDKNGTWYVSARYTNWKGEADRTVNQSFNQSGGQFPVSFDAFRVPRQRPVLLDLLVHSSQTIFQLFNFQSNVSNLAFVLFLVVKVFILGKNALDKVLIKAPHDAAQSLDFLFAAGDLIPQLRPFSGLLGLFSQ